MTTCACSNCQFFDTNASAKVRQMDGAGLCRFNPPMPQASSEAKAVWPVVGREDWCGHFAATVERMMTAAA